jgi:hypothetical protein
VKENSYRPDNFYVYLCGRKRAVALENNSGSNSRAMFIFASTTVSYDTGAHKVMTYRVRVKEILSPVFRDRMKWPCDGSLDNQGRVIQNSVSAILA